MNKQILAVANFRVSSDEQLLNNSLDRQEKAVRQAADELGATIVRYWSGSVSSKKWSNIERQDLDEMLAECKRNRDIKYAIFDELDRFMRSMLEIAYFVVEFKKLGVQVKFASQPNLKTDTATDTLVFMLEAFKAEGSNEERQRKSIAGHLNGLKEGKWAFNPKPGYIRGIVKAVPEVHPIRGPILRQTLMNICDNVLEPSAALVELNRSDFMQGHTPYKMDKFRKIVTDPFYAGVVEMDKQVKYRNENGLHKPLISLEQHYEIVRIMNGKKKNQVGPRKGGNPKYPLNRITVHDTCLEKESKGKLVGFDHGNGHSENLTYEKYRCRSKTCGQYWLRDDLHKQVLKLFSNNPITEKGSDDFVKALNIVWTKRESQAKQSALRISQKIQKLKDTNSSQALAAIDPANAAIKNEIVTNIDKQKQMILELEEELEKLSQTAETDKDKFLRFAFNFANDMGSQFLEISQDNRLKCKQIIFPAGFCVNAAGKVYTREISPLIRLAANKKDAEASNLAQMVPRRGRIPKATLQYYCQISKRSCTSQEYT